MQVNKRPLMVLAGVLLLLTGCSALPLPIPVDPGEYRSGQKTYYFGGLRLRSLEADIDPAPLQFDPPSTRLTYARGAVRAKLSVSTPERATGNIQAKAYIAPFSNGSYRSCDPRQVYVEKYRVGETTIPVNGAYNEVAFEGVLSPEAVAGLNEGKLCVGIRVLGEVNDYVSSVTISWQITYIQVGVGIL